LRRFATSSRHLVLKSTLCIKNILQAHSNLLRPSVRLGVVGDRDP
jgi:hypothetical protein